MAYADAVLADSPLGYWKLDEASGATCADSSGNGHDLTYGGTPHYSESGPFSGASAVLFDGVTGEGAVSTYASWMLPSDLTLECWVKSTVALAQVAIFGAATGRPSAGVYMLYFDGSGRVKGVFTNTGGTVTTVESATGLNDGAWHHVAFTHRASSGGSNNVLYVDGSAVATSAFGSGTPSAVSAPIRIGGCGSSIDADWLNGTVSHAAFYPSVLSAARIAAHYAAGAGIVLGASASVSATAMGNLTETSSNLGGAAGATASAAGAVQMAQSLVAAAVARASATGSMPTPGPGFGCWTRDLRPFARYGRAISFGYRPYYDDAGALAGAARAVATATGDLGLTVIGLAGDAVVRVAVTGDVNSGAIVAEQLSGNARVSGAVTGDLQTDNISGAAAGLATATGQMGMAAPLSAAAVARAIAAGTPSVLVPLGASAAVVSAVTGALLGSTRLAGDADGAASATGIANLLQSLSGSAASRAAAVAALTVGASMAGSAAAVGTVTGALGVGVDLDADAQARASATGATGVSVDLSGHATATAEAAGTLRDVGTVTGGTTYAVNLATGAATSLLNFDFERLVRAHSALYGLKGGALYKVAGDTDPGPAPISATLRLAPWMPPGVHQHRLDYFYLRARETDGLTVMPIYDETTGVPYRTAADARQGLRTTKVSIGLGNAWHSLGLIVANRDGGQLGLAGVEMVVSPLSRRPK